jgi:hypothetical protein
VYHHNPIQRWGKPKDSPNSYRATTLIPAVATREDTPPLVQWTRREQVPTSAPKRMNAGMTSFVVMESVRYAKERNNKLYAAFFDAEKAFDRVWIDGLLWKLGQIGVRGKYWNVVSSLYTDMNSCVLYNGHMSDTFPILQVLGKVVYYHPGCSYCLSTNYCRICLKLKRDYTWEVSIDVHQRKQTI